MQELKPVWVRLGLHNNQVQCKPYTSSDAQHVEQTEHICSLTLLSGVVQNNSISVLH